MLENHRAVAYSLVDDDSVFVHYLVYAVAEPHWAYRALVLGGECCFPPLFSEASMFRSPAAEPILHALSVALIFFTSAISAGRAILESAR